MLSQYKAKQLGLVHDGATITVYAAKNAPLKMLR
jgi:hypothetical protein